MFGSISSQFTKKIIIILAINIFSSTRAMEFAVIGSLVAAKLGYDYYSEKFLRAVFTGNVVLVKELLNNGYNVNQVFDNKFWRVLMPTHKVSNRTIVVWGDRPLHIAARNNDLPMVKLLLEKGALVNVQNHNLECPLQTTENINIIELLIKHGAEINVLDSRKVTPLVQAICVCNSGLVENLLLYGADPNIVTKSGKIPLHLAYENNSTDICKLLLFFGANNSGELNIVTEAANLSPLEIAILQGEKESIIHALSLNIKPSRDILYELLSLAIGQKKFEIVQLILNTLGDNPLLNAIINNDMIAAIDLLAESNILDLQEASLHYATKRTPEIETVLRYALARLEKKPRNIPLHIVRSIFSRSLSQQEKAEYLKIKFLLQTSILTTKLIPQDPISSVITTDELNKIKSRNQSAIPSDPVLLAAITNDIEKINELVSDDTPLELLVKALFYASFQGDLEIVSILTRYITKNTHHDEYMENKGINKLCYNQEQETWCSLKSDGLGIRFDEYIRYLLLPRLTLAENDCLIPSLKIKYATIKKIITSIYECPLCNDYKVDEKLFVWPCCSFMHHLNCWDTSNQERKKCPQCRIIPNEDEKILQLQILSNKLNAKPANQENQQKWKMEIDKALEAHVNLDESLKLALEQNFTDIVLLLLENGAHLTQENKNIFYKKIDGELLEIMQVILDEQPQIIREQAQIVHETRSGTLLKSLLSEHMQHLFSYMMGKDVSVAYLLEQKLRIARIEVIEKIFRLSIAQGNIPLVVRIIKERGPQLRSFIQDEMLPLIKKLLSRNKDYKASNNYWSINYILEEFLKTSEQASIPAEALKPHRNESYNEPSDS